MLRLIRTPLLLLLFCALPLTAEEVTILPAGPTTDTPVTLRLDVFCNPIVSHTVTRTGSRIRIDVTPRPGSCPSPPLPLPYDVPVGTLPSGEYAVEVHIHDRTITKSFVVRNVAPGEVDIHPFAVPTEPFGLRLRAVNAPACAADDCSNVTVNIGGAIVPSSRIKASNDGSIFFDAPPHAPGLVDVSITANGITYTTKNALYYYTAGAPPDLSAWERILFPVLFNSGGAHGSNWVSEAAIANPTRWFVQNFNRIDPLPCIDFGCSELLAPASFLSFGGAGYANGVALLVPRAEAEHLSFSLRVRDVARQVEGYGTEVPVVREKDMYRDDRVMTLLDVPLDPRYRTKVRVYDFGDLPGAWVALHDPADGPRLTGTPITMRRSCSGAACEYTPWYGELDLPPGKVDQRVNVYVQGGQYGSLTWAFASVTNNETQQVTLITPDGHGGLPCNPQCGVK
jgi:hypothetical protein